MKKVHIFYFCRDFSAKKNRLINRTVLLSVISFGLNRRIGNHVVSVLFFFNFNFFFITLALELSSDNGQKKSTKKYELREFQSNYFK